MIQSFIIMNEQRQTLTITECQSNRSEYIKKKQQQQRNEQPKFAIEKKTNPQIKER